MGKTILCKLIILYFWSEGPWQIELGYNYQPIKKLNREVQEEPQAEVAANLRRKRKHDTD